MRHVGRCPAHIEADNLVKPGRSAGAHCAYHTCGRSREDAVLTLEQPAVHQAAVGLHKQQTRAGQLAGDGVDIAPQDRRQVGVHHRCVATADQLHERTDIKGGGHLGKTDLPRKSGNPLLMRGITIGVHEHNRGRTDTLLPGSV